jgi:hypothetical protein
MLRLSKAEDVVTSTRMAHAAAACAADDDGQVSWCSHGLSIAGGCEYSGQDAMWYGVWLPVQQDPGICGSGSGMRSNGRPARASCGPDDGVQFCDV